MNFEEGYQKVVEKSCGDDAYRARLISNPNEAIKEVVGIGIPAGITFRVHEDTATTLNFVLPPLPSTQTAELSDVELEQVAGGKGIGGFSYCRIKWMSAAPKPFTFI